MAKTRILWADDHNVLRSGLKYLLNAQSDMNVVGEAATGNETLRFARELAPDVLILDIAMPGLDGLDVLKELKRAAPTIRVLTLTMHEEEGYLRRALELGAAGYCPKSAADAELISAVLLLNSMVRSGETNGLEPSARWKVIARGGWKNWRFPAAPPSSVTRYDRAG
jgi:two-component system response regulator NreC